MAPVVHPACAKTGVICACLQHLMGGLFGLTLAMLVEMTLFVIRTGVTPPAAAASIPAVRHQAQQAKKTQ